MTKGPRRLVLDQYLDTASEGALTGAGSNWTKKATDLDVLGAALKRAAEQAELKIGEQTLTGPAVRASMEEAAGSLEIKSQQLHAAGTALTNVGMQLGDTREARDSIKDLGPKPTPYQAPAGTAGVPPTSEELTAQAEASQARADERSAWQTQYDKQEAKSLALTREMDTAFLAAIPPMKAIHGQQDPTEPPPNVPTDNGGGTYLPGTQAPPVTGGGNGGNGGDSRDRGVLVGIRPDNGDDGDGRDRDKDRDDDDKDRERDPQPPVPPTVITFPPTEVHTPLTHVTHVGSEAPTSTISGSSQSGITYQPTGSQVSAPVSVGGSSAGVSAAALGAAGGAAGMAAGGIRPGAAAAASGSSAPVRAIGSTGRAGSAGALSRAAGTGSGSAAGRAGSAGSPASRSAGSAAGRAASTGSASGRGSAGSRGAGSATGSQGSRSGGRGASGARSAGAAAGAGRGGRKGERDQTTDRDRLVYDQDWLGDDDVAPGVLD